MNMRSSIHKYDACDITCIHPDAVAEAKKAGLDRGGAEELAKIFQVMSDPTRLRIISLLAERELCVCDISAALEMSQSAVSHQLRVMRISRIVKYRKQGRIAFYSLDDDHVIKLFSQGLSHVAHGNPPASVNARR